MIKIQARMVVIPHTMAVCLIYSSMQAPGLFVPGLSACKVQGLFTFSPGLRKQAAHTFMLRRVLDGGLLQLYTPQAPSPQHLKASFLSFFSPCPSYRALCRPSFFSTFLPYFCPHGRFHLQKTPDCQTGVNVKESSSPLLQKLFLFYVFLFQ